MNQNEVLLDDTCKYLDIMSRGFNTVVIGFTTFSSVWKGCLISVSSRVINVLYTRRLVPHRIFLNEICMVLVIDKYEKIAAQLVYRPLSEPLSKSHTFASE